MTSPANDRLASIIIPCWNQLEFTRLCLAALVRHTRPPWELLVIDNGSTDETGSYLSGVGISRPCQSRSSATPRTLASRRRSTRGSGRRGEYLVLLNNDAVVTDGWLSRLFALTEGMDQAGITM